MLFHTVKLVAVQNLLTAILREINCHEERDGEIRGLHLSPLVAVFGLLMNWSVFWVSSKTIWFPIQTFFFKKIKTEDIQFPQRKLAGK